MLKRPSEFTATSESLEERITLSPGDNVNTRYDAWLKDKMSQPRFCRRHPGTQLVLDRAGSRIGQAYNYDERSPRPWGAKQALVPGAFHLKAALRCPACRCAFARCPLEFHETSFETFDTSTQERLNGLSRCREFAAQLNEQKCGMAGLVGGPGTGKTRLACNVISVLDNADALYARQAELTCELRATYGRKDIFLHRSQQAGDVADTGEDEPTPLGIVQEVHFLALDELGCTALANDEILFLDELLRHRYDQRKATMLISNLGLNKLRDVLGDALYDRIRHASGGGKFILQFKGDSYRRGTGENYLEGLT